jgi:hypothetical protein
MLKIIIALIMFAIADDACAGRKTPPRKYISRSAHRVLGVHAIHTAIKEYHPRKQKG